MREEGPRPVKTNQDGDYLIIDHKLSHVSYKLAKCCHPGPSDEVFGFVTAKEGIKLHRRSCPNAQRLYEKYEYRIIPVQWKPSDAATAFWATIKVTSDAATGLAGQVEELIGSLSVNLTSFSMEAKYNRKGKAVTEGVMTVYLNNTQQFDRLMMRLKKMKGVLAVRREG